MWELFAQVGPVVSVHMPKDKVTGLAQGYGFVEFRGEDDADYAVKVLNMTKLFGKPLRVSKASADRARASDVGANLFVGNLGPDVDEKTLYDTFSAFGGIVGAPRVQRDPESGISKGFGFVSFDSFEASDLAIECMSGQFLADRQIVVQYALRKDSKGERHGSAAERMLAAASAKRGGAQLKPHTHFATAMGAVTSILPAPGHGGGAQMLGTPLPAPPPMLPPTAILPSSFGLRAGGSGFGGQPQPAPLQPPPLPSSAAGGGGVGAPLAGRLGTMPAWMQQQQAAAAAASAGAPPSLAGGGLPASGGHPQSLQPPPLPGGGVLAAAVGGAPPSALPPMLPPPLPAR
jgi:splicing factor 3B subunit 4